MITSTPEVRRLPALVRAEESVVRLRDLLDTALADSAPGIAADAIMSAMSELDNLSIEIDAIGPFPPPPIGRWGRIALWTREYLR